MIFLAACAPSVNAPEPAAAPVKKPKSTAAPLELFDPTSLAPPVEYAAKWRAGVQAKYLLPIDGLVAKDGGFDLVIHFHGGQVADKEWRNSGINAAIAIVTLGVGSGVYSEAYADPDRLGKLTDEIEGIVADQTPNKAVHVRRIGLVSWSAGYGATQRILTQPRYAPLVDAVVLLDGLHADYHDRVAHKVDIRPILPFVRFAGEAAQKKKQMVITFSSVEPGAYASARESTIALLDAVAVKPEVRDQQVWMGMRMILEAHEGDLHARGFAGDAPDDHASQLKLTEEMVRRHLVPRWNKMAKEQP